MTLLNQNTLIELEKDIIKEGGLAEFIKLSWNLVEPDPLVWNWHIDLICYALEQSLVDPEYRNLIVCIPPGCMKTLCCSVFFPAWVWTHSPGKKFIYSSYAQDVSNKSAKQHRNIVNSDWYQERWGNICTITKDTIAQVGFFENMQHGFRFSTSVGGQVTGRHADILVFDDLLKAQDAFSDLAMEKANDFWFNTMATRQSNPKKTVKIGIMQRLHTDDPAARCIDAGYKSIILPMQGPAISSTNTLESSQDALEGSVNKQTTPCITRTTQGSTGHPSYTVDNSINRITSDPRTSSEELLWESRFDLQTVETIRKSLGPINASAQLDQNPVPLGGAMFKLKDFDNKWTEIPTDATWILSVDCSFEDEKTAINPDYTVIQVWAQKSPNFYLVDQVRRKMDVIDATKAILDLTIKYPKVTGVHVEKKAGGAAVMRMLSDHIPGVKPYPPRGERMSSKSARANAVLPLMPNVFYPSPEPHWFQDFVKEMITFPRSKNDDCVDAFSQALDILHKPQNNSFINAMNKARSDLRIGRSPW